jgi:hypothetical protein
MGHALARQGNLGLDFSQGLRYIFCVLTAAIFMRRLRSGQVHTERSHRGLVRAFAKCLRLTTSVGSNPTLSVRRGVAQLAEHSSPNRIAPCDIHLLLLRMRNVTEAVVAKARPYPISRKGAGDNSMVEKSGISVSGSQAEYGESWIV